LEDSRGSLREPYVLLAIHNENARRSIKKFAHLRSAFVLLALTSG
jgi:hypothetical protein